MCSAWKVFYCFAKFIREKRSQKLSFAKATKNFPLAIHWIIKWCVFRNSQTFVRFFFLNFQLTKFITNCIKDKGIENEREKLEKSFFNCFLFFISSNQAYKYNLMYSTSFSRKIFHVKLFFCYLRKENSTLSKKQTETFEEVSKKFSTSSAEK